MSILQLLHRARLFQSVRVTGHMHRMTSTLNESGQRQKLVILGTGWGSYAVLKTIDKSKFDVIVVSPRNHFLFTPLLASTTVGTLEFRSIIEPVRNTIFRHAEHFHLSYATALDATQRILHCQSAVKHEHKYSLHYDKLVIGVGAMPSTFGTPGVEEHALFLKEVSDARRIRNRILSNFEVALQPEISVHERQRLLHVVIVGGGPTGVEFGAELYDFIKQDVSRLYGEESLEIRVTLIESNRILGSFDDRLQAYAEKKLRARPGFELVQSSVKEVKEDAVILHEGQVLPCGLVVWSTGLAPRPFVKNLPFLKNDRGQIVTDERLRVMDGSPLDSVFAIGDCADIQKKSLPCTAQVAEREGRYLSKQLNSLQPTDQFKAFEFKSMGMLAYIGGYEALSDLPDFKLQGFPSWFLWRSAYLTRLGSWRLRMQVPMDWTKTLLYGRDVSRFD